MLYDKAIHTITNGEPLKDWLVKIALISVLLPIHHWTEKTLIAYLLAKKKIHLSRHFSFKNPFLQNKKPPPEKTEGDIVPVEQEIKND